MGFQKGHTPWNKGLIKETDERIRKKSEAQKGKKPSKKTREKMSKSQLERKRRLGYMNSPETREKIRKAEKGLHNSPETEFKKGHQVLDKWRKSWSERNKKLIGEKALNWQDGKTSKNERIRKSEKYKEWRRKVFERDNYVCQDCGKKNCYLEAHHVLSFRDFPESRFNVSNGKTLCLRCHNKTKRKQPKVKIGV